MNVLIKLSKDGGQGYYNIPHLLLAHLITQVVTAVHVSVMIFPIIVKGMYVYMVKILHF